MKFVYTPNTNEIIIEHEDKVLEKYLKIINTYSGSFAQYGCTLKVGRVWNNFPNNTNLESRIPFKNGYNCYVFCNIERDGKVVRFDDVDGEVDYYELSACWNISSITRFFFRLNVCLYEDTSDIAEELDSLLKMLALL